MMHVADCDSFGADVALRERVVLVAANRHDMVAIDIELQPAHCLAECASPENGAYHGHGVTPIRKPGRDFMGRRRHYPALKSHLFAPKRRPRCHCSDDAKMSDSSPVAQMDLPRPEQVRA